MTTVTLQMPDEVLAWLREEPEGFGAELRLAAAMNWYRRGTVSQEVAAQVAGLDRTDFLLALARHGEDVFRISLTDLSREVLDSGLALVGE
jgi:predicted HTH domain antitoxin